MITVMGSFNFRNGRVIITGALKLFITTHKLFSLKKLLL